MAEAPAATSETQIAAKDCQRVNIKVEIDHPLREDVRITMTSESSTAFLPILFLALKARPIPAWAQRQVRVAIWIRAL